MMPTNDDPESPPAAILLVGAEAADLLALETALDGLGADLVTAAGGEEALAALLGRDFAAVLLDVRLPGLGGFETARLIREHERSKDTPILFLSASRDDPDFPVEAAYAFGAVDYLSRPIVPLILRSKVAVFLNLSRRTQAASRAEAEARELLANVLATVDDQFAILDQDLRFTYVNDRLVQAGGVAREDLLGRRLVDAFPDLAGTNFERELTRAVARRMPAHFEFHDARQGRWYDNRANPTRGGLMLASTEITAMKKAEELRNHLAAIVESSDDVIVSKTLGGIITSWNKGAERVLGYTAEEVIGQHVSMLMPPEAIEDTEKILGKIRRGEKVDHYLTKRRRKDGTIIDVALTVSPIRDAEGKVVGASKVGRDVTETNRAAELKERLAAIVESSDDAIVSKTLDGIITSWNKGAERILGYTADEVIGQHVSMLMPPEAREDTEKILGKIRRGEKVEHYETKRRRKDGTIIDVALTVSPIRDRSGRVIGASKIGRDITQQKRHEAERLEADRRKDEFLAMLAHELRNPLSSINSAIQLFGKLETEEELEWAKEVVQRQVKHLARLIDDLLDVSRISRGKIVLQRETLDLAPIVSGAIDSVRPMMEERKQELTLSLASGLRLEGDPLRLEQVLVNLLSNAAKYTDAGGKISLSARLEGHDVVVKVRDTGMGITPELLPRVFDLFTQGDRTMARSEGGLGIGLALVQKLVAMHGGSIAAESEGPGQGSEFTVRLPARKEAPARSSGSRDVLPRVARRGSRVLVVDDNLDNARGLSRLLKLLGHDVRVAHDGPGALEAAHAHRPEIVLLDIGLPGMDGYQVVRNLRKDPCCKDALIIAISGYGQPDDLRRSKESGFDHHLVKPVDFDALMSLFAPYGH